MTEYLDFEIEIGIGIGREYPIAVIRSPGGEAREQMVFPFDELALDGRLKDLQIALLRSGGQRRLLLTPQEQTIQDFGQKLFTALMTGEVRSRFDVSQREASRQGKGLRIKLRIQPPELASLPWEFLFDPRAGEYICLSTQTPIIRYIEIPQVIQPLSIAPPLHILVVSASPIGLVSLDIENEKRRLGTALQDLIGSRQFEITWLEHTTWRTLQRTMRRGPWHILHFMGHGGFDRGSDEGILALEDEYGGLNRLPATQLARLLADHTTLRLVILNSCEGAQGGNTDVFSSTASILVRCGLPAVLAMQYPITDRAAIEFSRGFYEAIADGFPVDAATTEARKSVSLGVTNTLEWGTPVLFMHTPDGVLFRHETPMDKTLRTAVEEAEAKTRLVAQRDAAEEVAKGKVEKEVVELPVHEQAESIEQRLVTEKVVIEKAESKAIEEVDRLAREKKEEERIALEKVEADLIAKEQADRVAKKKKEEELITQLKAESEPKEMQEAQQLSVEKTAHELAERQAVGQPTPEPVPSRPAVGREAPVRATKAPKTKGQEKVVANPKWDRLKSRPVLFILIGVVLVSLLILVISSLSGRVSCPTVEDCMTRANPLRDQGDLAGYLKYSDAALARVPADQHPRYAFLWCDRGDVEKQLGQIDQAMSCFNICMDWTQGDPNLQSMRDRAAMGLAGLR